MVFVLLSTVLAPGFGWEVAASLSTHSESAQLDGDIHEVHERTVPIDSDEALRHELHGCPGHLFGHFGGTLSSSWLAPTNAGNEVVLLYSRAMQSLTPEAAGHPPKFFLPAQFAHNSAGCGWSYRRQPACWRKLYAQESSCTDARPGADPFAVRPLFVRVPPCVGPDETIPAVAAVEGNTSVAAFRSTKRTTRTRSGGFSPPIPAILTD